MGLGGSDEGGTSGFFKEPRNGRRRTCCPSNLLISIFYQLPSDKSNTMCYQRRETVKKKKKTKIMASGPSASQQIDGAKVETVTDFIFLGYKITADGD